MTSAPWRLPQPPGLHPNATSMRASAGAAAATAGLNVDDDAPVFSFQRRYHKLNWREILHIDLNCIIQHVDLAALHQQLEPITFADIGEDDLAYFTDGNFVHLFRLCQLLLEYQLFAWQASTVSNNLRVAKYAQLKAHVVKLKAKAAHAAAENKTLKKELRYCKQVVAALEERNHGSGHGHGHVMAAGSVGRYPHQIHAPLFPHAPLAHPPAHAHAHSSSRAFPAATAGAPAELPPNPFEQARAEASAAADQHAHYAAQFEAFQSSVSKQLRETLQAENEKRNAKLESLQTALQLLLEAQKDEVNKQHAQSQQQQQQQLQQGHLLPFVPSPKAHEEEKSNPNPAAPVPTPSQAAQQQLITSILSEVVQLKNASASGDAISIAAFEAASSPAIEPPAVAALPTASTSGRVSQVYNFEQALSQLQSQSQQQQQLHASSPVAGAPVPAAVTALPSPSMLPVAIPASGASALRPAAPARVAKAKPDFTPAQQAEVDSLSAWLRLIEAEELGAELLKMQQEAALVARAAEEERARALRHAEEAEVRRIEAAVPPDHPLLADTIMASPRNQRSVSSPRAGAAATAAATAAASHVASVTAPVPVAPLPSPAPSPAHALAAPGRAPSPSIAAAPSPQPSPSASASWLPPTLPVASADPGTGTGPGLTIEVTSPVSMPLTRPLLVGNSLIAPPAPLPIPAPSPPLALSSSARAPVLPPAPLADSEPLPSLEEKAAALLPLSPTSRIRALEHEKHLLKLRAVISARSSVDRALFAPFPSLPYLPSLYNHAPEELRECYDLVYTWADTAMRTQEGAGELLRYAVQMDCTGEIYGEVASNLDALVGEHYRREDDQAIQAQQRRIAELEAANAAHGAEERARQLREARWQETRIASFEAQWNALERSKEDQDAQAALSEQLGLQAREAEFRAYMLRLEEADRQQREKVDNLAGRTREKDPAEVVPISGAAVIPRHYHPYPPIGAEGAATTAPATVAAAAASPADGRDAAATHAPASPVAGSGAARHSAGRTSPPLPRKMHSPRAPYSPHAPVTATATTSARLPRAALRTAADGDTEEEDGEADEQEDEDEGEEGGVAHFRQPRTASPALRSSSRHISATSSLAASPVRTQRSLQQQQPPPQQQSQTHLQPTPPATANLEHKSQERAQRQQQQQEEGAEESDDEPAEEDDDDAAARRAVARMAASPLASSTAAQFSRPGAASRAQGIRPSAAAVANAAPDKSARPVSAALRPAAQIGNSGGGGGTNTLYSAGTSMMGGGSGVGAGARPKTSVGSGRSRFAAGRFNDSFEDDLDDDEEEARGTGQPQLGAEENEETEEPMHQRSVTPPPPQHAQFGGQNDARAGVGSGGGSRTLNPRRAAGVNLSSVQGSLSSGVAASPQGGFVSPSRPPVESAHLGGGGDSDAEVSDVSSVINLNEGVATRAHAVAAAEAAGRPHTPPAASPSLAPALGSATIGSAVVQGRGRPRGQPSKLSGGGSNPSPPPRFGGDHGDSLSSLLGGGMRRPGGGRGLSSGPGSFRSKLPVAAVLDSDDDDDIDMY